MTETLRDQPRYEICVCGHPKDTHENVTRDLETGEILPERVEARCNVLGWDCGCETFNSVLRVSTTQSFKRISRGSAEKHALVVGVTRLLDAGGQMEWIEGDVKCSECSEDGPVMPFRTRVDTGVTDKLLCQKCSENVTDAEIERRKNRGIVL